MWSVSKRRDEPPDTRKSIEFEPPSEEESVLLSPNRRRDLDSDDQDRGIYDRDSGKNARNRDRDRDNYRARDDGKYSRDREDHSYDRDLDDRKYDRDVDDRKFDGDREDSEKYDRKKSRRRDRDDYGKDQNNYNLEDRDGDYDRDSSYDRGRKDGKYDRGRRKYDQDSREYGTSENTSNATTPPPSATPPPLSSRSNRSYRSADYRKYSPGRRGYDSRNPRRNSTGDPNNAEPFIELRVRSNRSRRSPSPNRDRSPSIPDRPRNHRRAYSEKVNSNECWERHFSSSRSHKDDLDDCATPIDRVSTPYFKNKNSKSHFPDDHSNHSDRRRQRSFESPGGRRSPRGRKNRDREYEDDIKLEYRPGYPSRHYEEDRRYHDRREKSSKTRVVSYLVNSRGHRERFELPSRYEAIKIIGEGAYATVIEAKDTKYSKLVAIKKNRNVFDSRVNATRVLRELQLLARAWHPDVIELQGALCPDLKDIETFEDLYLIMPKMDATLSKVVQVSELSTEHIKYLLYQMLRGLLYLHSAGVIHRDLKTENVLVNGENSDLKIADFGLVKSIQQFKDDVEMTQYVSTRWYRAPQIVCGFVDYGYEVDVWAVGCIFAEMLLKEPLFQGHSNIDQMKRIFRVLGTPTRRELDWVKEPRVMNWLCSFTDFPENGSFYELFANQSKDCKDLLRRLLEVNPKDRITVSDALSHPFLRDVREKNTEVRAPEKILVGTRRPEFDGDWDESEREPDDRILATIFGCRHLIFQELKCFRRIKRRAKQLAELKSDDD